MVEKTHKNPIVTPCLAADIIIELVDRPGRPIVLIERVNPPHGWAIPGGFVDPGERVEQAAVREALEETSLAVQLITLLGVYSDPLRDPRMATVSMVYVAQASGLPQAADDARQVRICQVGQWPDQLAFDHPLILEDYRRFRETGQLAPLRER